MESFQKPLLGRYFYLPYLLCFLLLAAAIPTILLVVSTYLLHQIAYFNKQYINGRLSKQVFSSSAFRLSSEDGSRISNSHNLKDSPRWKNSELSGTIRSSEVVGAKFKP